MFIMRLTERPYVAYTEDEVRRSFRSSVRLTFSNTHFDPHLGAELYNEYLDEYDLSEEAGFDGLMLNKHHNTPTCMGAAMNLEAAILARITKKPRIVRLGNPLPIFDNPIRLAEVLAEIDMISRCRCSSMRLGCSLAKARARTSFCTTLVCRPCSNACVTCRRWSSGAARTVSCPWNAANCIVGDRWRALGSG